MRRSIEDIEECAQKLRKKLGIDDLVWLDPITLLQKARKFLGVSWIIEELSASIEGHWDPARKLISLPQHVRSKAHYGDGRARMTIAHELCHAYLGHAGSRNRSIHESFAEKFIKSIKADESEAKRLAAALLAPFHKIAAIKIKDANELASRFGLSKEAASIRFSQYQDYLRRLNGETRTVPDFVKQTLAELSRPTERLPSMKLSFHEITCVGCGNQQMVQIGNKLLCLDCDHIQPV